MSKGKQHHSNHANPTPGFRKGRKAVRGLSAAIIASAMMGSGAVAQTIWDTDATTGSFDYGPFETVILRAGATRSANNPGTTWFGAAYYQLEDGTIDRINLSDSVIGLGSTAYLAKTTNGTATILGTQSYSGNTLVYGGTLRLGQGGSDGAYDGQILSNEGIFVFNAGNLEVRYADGSSFDKDLALIGDNATFTSWVEGANSVNFIDGVITGGTAPGDWSGDGGRFDKRGAGTTNIRGGVVISGDLDVWNGALTVEGAVTASDIQTGLHGNSNTQVRVDGGGITANIHLRLGADLAIEDGGSVDGNVTWSGDDTDTASTNVTITEGSNLEGNVVINNGNVSLLNGIDDTDLGRSHIGGNVSILGAGNVTAANFGSIVGNVSVNDGDISLSNTSQINGKVDLASGVLSLSGASFIAGAGVDIVNGYATITGGSTIQTNLSVDDAGIGGVAVTITDSGVWGAVTVRLGDVRVTRGHIQNDVNITEEGSLLVTGVGQGVEGNVTLANGNVDVTSDGNIDGNVTVNDNNVTVDNGRIGGNVTARDGEIEVNNDGVIVGNASVRDGAITVDNDSAIVGNASVRDGVILVDNDSAIVGNATVRDGSIVVDNDSAVVGNASIRDGSIVVDNDSAIVGSATARNGSVTVDNDSAIVGSVSISGIGDLLVDNDSFVGGVVTLEDGDLDVLRDSLVNADVFINTGSVFVSDSEIDGEVNIGTGNLTALAGSLIDSNVLIGSGFVLLNDSEIDGSVNIGTGDLDAINDSLIDGDVFITTGSVLLNDSEIDGSVNIGTGDLDAINDSFIDGDVFVTTGSVFLNDSEIDGGVNIGTGDLTALNGSEIGGDVLVGNGTVDINDTDIDGDVTIISGDFIAYNNSDVDGNVLITSGNATLNNSDIDGSLTVTSGDVSLDDSTVGSFFGDNGIHMGNGLLTLANNSFVIGDSVLGNVDVIFTGDSDILGNVSVASGYVNLTGNSDIIGNLDVFDGSLTLTNGSGVTGDVTVNGETYINIASGIGGNILSYNGNVVLDNGSGIEGHATLQNGDLILDNQSGVANGATIQDGNIVLAHNSTINRSLFGGQDVTVEHGSVNLLTGSAISNTVNVLAGQVTVVENSYIAGDVNVTESRIGDDYAVGVDNATIDGDVFVGRGNIIVDDAGEINGDVTVLDGNIDLNFGSEINAAFLGDNVFVALGNVTLDNYSEINSDVTVNRGNVDLNLGSDINGDVTVLLGDVSLNDDSQIVGSVSITDEGNLSVTNHSGVFGDVDVNRGAVTVVHESVIVGDVNVNGTDLHPGAVTVNEESTIIGSVTVGTGDILVDNFSAINGTLITTALGDIDVLNDSAITGHVIINDGHLEIDSTSAVNGIVDVNAEAAAHIGGIVNGDVNLYGGVLYGNPTITGDLWNSGLLTPGYRFGNPVGTARIGNDYIQTADGTYRADIRANGTHDRVLVGGEAILGGNLLVVTDANYKRYRNDRFRLLRAEGGRVGRFDNVIHGLNDTMLTFNIRYSPKSVWAVVEQRKFAELQGLTHNQRQVAHALDHAAVRNQLDKAFDHLNYTNVSNVPALLQLLSPEQLTSIFTISTASAQLQNVNIERRLDAVRAGRARAFSNEGFSMRNDRGTINVDGPIANTADGFSIAGWDGKSVVTKEVVEPIVHQSRWSVYLTGHGDWATIKNTNEALGQDFRTAGVSVGADLQVSENFVFGITGGYTNTQADLAHDGEIKVNSGRGSIYASYYGGGAYLNAAVGGGYNSYKTKRATLGGFASGDSDGGELNALLGLGYDFRVGGFSIGPVASAQYTYTGLSSFSETGSDAPQHFDSQHNDSFRTLVGLKIDYAINAGNVVIRPEVRAQWKHEYLDTAPSITARFAGADKYFTVNGPDIGRDSLVLDAGASVEFNNTWSVFAYYTGELGRKNYDSHSVNGGFRVSF